jgi:Cft2 family RNA processing exonuclease
MKLITLSSSSHGNCHILETDTSQLILDCGVKSEKVLKNIDMNKLEGILITHQHS